MDHTKPTKAAATRLIIGGALMLAALTACSSSLPGPGSGTGGNPGTGGSPAGAGGATGGSIGTGGTAGHQTGGASGAGGSAGTTATGGMGGGTVGSGCAGKPYKLCEDFETGTAGGVPSGWTKLNGYGSSAGVGLATDAAHSGAMSLKSDSAVTGQSRVQKSLSGLGATATKHWGRIFYKVQSPAVKPASGVIHITLTALEGTTEDRIVDTVEDTNGKHQWLFNIPDDSCCTGSTYDWSFDAAWHCAEWYVDQSTQSFRFFSDGAEVTSIGFTNRAGAKMSNWSSIAVGTIFYQTPPAAIVVWFDDLAIDDNQIGCQ